VLIVEDDFFIAEDLADAFRAQGAVILGPVSGIDAALALVEAAPGPDAAVLDLNLGAVMSYPIADALMQRRVPFVFTTGYDASAILPHYRSVPRCEKPVDLAQVTRMLRGMTQGHEGK
jgi:CheY-like chemotaxis protein